MEPEGNIDPSSPYYLGSGDQPGALITHVSLKGDNYLAWSRALKSRRKFVFIDGTITKPKDKKMLLEWKTVNFMIVSWMLRSMEPKISAVMPYHEHAKQLWDAVAKKYRVTNGPRLQQLRSAITDCKQTKSMTMEDYYSKLIGLYDDLFQLKPLRVCECGLCTCDLARHAAADRDEEILHQFLIGVDDVEYSVVRSNLLSRDPMPTLDEAYLALVQEERSKGIARAKAVKEMVPHQGIYAIRSTSRSSSRMDKPDKSNLVYTHCNQNGHDHNTCFKLHGYPDWYEEMRARRAKLGSSSRTAPSSHNSTVRPTTTVKANAISSTMNSAPSSVVPVSSEPATLSDLKPD